METSDVLLVDTVYYVDVFYEWLYNRDQIDCYQNVLTKLNVASKYKDQNGFFFFFNQWTTLS